MGDRETLKQQLDQLAESVRNRRQAALALTPLIPSADVFVAVCGLELPKPSYELVPGEIVLRQVTNPPDFLDLYGAAVRDRADYFGLGRWAGGTSAEFLVGDGSGDETASRTGIGLAWHAAALIKLRTAADIFCPGAASVSWDTVAAHQKNDVEFYLLDDAPGRVVAELSRNPMDQSDIDWAAGSYVQALKLRDIASSRRFGLAFEVAYTWNLTADRRLALASLWVGLEALFGDSSDRPVTRKLVERIAAWLEDDNPDAIAALYDRRCDVVHGRWTSDDDLSQPVHASWSLLGRSLIAAIDRGKPTLPDWDATSV